MPVARARRPASAAGADCPTARTAAARSLHSASTALLAVAVLLLAACAHVPRSPAVPTASWSDQRAALLARQQYQFSGRLAVAANGEGFSGGIDWQQRDSESAVRLRGPLGVGALQLRYDGRALSVQTADGQSVGGAVAAALLHDSLGFDAPLASLAYWLRGCDDPASVAETTLDDQQRLATLKQQGWELRYDVYERHGVLWLPQRITLQRDAVRLKLLIQSWTLPG
jgi:outer membrane lipoprotein LolB